MYAFFQSTVASVLLYVVVCWGDSNTADDKNIINKLKKEAGSIVGCPLDSLELGGGWRQY